MINAAPLKAGAAQVDVTPKMGTQIAGDIGRRRPAELILEPLYARALIVEAGGRKLCFLSLDLAVVTREWADRIRSRAAQEFGLDPEAVMVHAVQNHAAPGVGAFLASEQCKLLPPDLWWVRGDDPRYNPVAVEGALEAIRRAHEALAPAWVGAASGLEARPAYNRRFVLRDGTAVTHPKPSDMPNILHVEGPIDPELGVVCFNSESARPAALLLHYTCHPVHGYPLRYVIGGWPGVWCAEMQKVCGSQCTPLVLNGCCGNIHHANHLDPGYVDDHRRMGRLLAETADKVLRTIRYSDAAALDYRSRHIQIPYRKLPPEEIEKARRLIEANPEPVWRDAEHTAIEWDWVYAVALLDLRDRQQREPCCDLEVQVFRLGDIAFVALPGEPFVEGQLRIKQGSPVRHTYVAHMANSFAGYIPTVRAFAGGGYETRVANWSKLAPEALDTLAEEAVALLRETFEE